MHRRDEDSQHFAAIGPELACWSAVLRVRNMSGQRTSFHFSREAAVQLKAIRARTLLIHSADVIRVALHTYNELLGLHDAGLSLNIRSKDGEEWDYSPYKKCLYPGMARASASGDDEDESAIPRNFFFSGEAKDNLESIRKRSFINTNSDAIRIALTAYKELCIIDEVGDCLVVRDAYGNEEIYNPYRPFSPGRLVSKNAKILEPQF
jgi:hypothetical protein